MLNCCTYTTSKFTSNDYDLLFSFELCSKKITEPFIAAHQIQYLAIFFWIMPISSCTFPTPCTSSILAIFFWIMPSGHGTALRLQAVQACYFLLNYAEEFQELLKELKKKTCYFLLNYAVLTPLAFMVVVKPLAIFFWIMQTVGNCPTAPALFYRVLLFSFELCAWGVRLWPTWYLSWRMACYFLLNYAEARRLPVGQDTRQVQALAIFFWIMPPCAVFSQWWTHIWSLTCYFLLNYAWRRDWKPKHSDRLTLTLLFSFELCSTCYWR